MKKITIIFIIAELLDCLTTFIGIKYLHMMELNPLVTSWWIFMWVKLFAIVVVSIALQKRNYKIAWIFPTLAGLPVVWNIINIAIEIVI